MTTDLNLRGIPAFRAECSLKAENRDFPYSGIWLFTGPQGSGKTLLAMHNIKKILELYPDCLLCSNISIFGVPCIPFRSVDQFSSLFNGRNGIIFFIDEIHSIWSSTDSKDMNGSLLAIWSQNRKNRRLIIGTSQRFSRVAKPIREQTSLNIESLKPVLWFRRYQVFDGSLYDDNGRYMGEKSPRMHFYVPNVKCMRMYNTLEVVKKEGVNNGLANG